MASSRQPAIYLTQLVGVSIVGVCLSNASPVRADYRPGCQIPLNKPGDGAARQACEQAVQDMATRNYAGALRVLEQLFARQRPAMSDPVLRYLSALYGSAVQGGQLESQARERLLKASTTDRSGWTNILLSNMALSHVPSLSFRNPAAMAAVNAQQEQVHQRILAAEHPHPQGEKLSAIIKQALLVAFAMFFIAALIVRAESLQIRYAILGGVWGSALASVEWNVPMALIFLNATLGESDSFMHLVPNLIMVMILFVGCIEGGRRFGRQQQLQMKGITTRGRILYYLLVCMALPVVLALPLEDYWQTVRHQREAAEYRKKVSDQFAAVAPKLTAMHFTPSWDHYQVRWDLQIDAKLDGTYKLGVQLSKSASEPFFGAADSYRALLLGANTISSDMYCYDLIPPDFRAAHSELRAGGPAIREQVILLMSLTPADPMKMFQGQSMTVPYDPVHPLNLHVDKTYLVTLDITTDGTSILCTPVNSSPERS